VIPTDIHEPAICETIIEESDDKIGSEEPTPQERDQSWFPGPQYKVSSLGSYESSTYLDSHADTTVLGKHCLVVYETGRTADVSPFLPELGTAEKVQIITGTVTYDHPDSETIILIINQVLYIPALRDNLVCDNQCRMNVSLSENPTDDSHTLQFRNHNDYTTSMDLRGTISYFPPRKPTAREYEDCRHIEMTAETPEWDPHMRDCSMQMKLL
jgi:hypothetical protein